MRRLPVEYCLLETLKPWAGPEAQFVQAIFANVDVKMFFEVETEAGDAVI